MEKTDVFLRPDQVHRLTDLNLTITRTGSYIEDHEPRPLFKIKFHKVQRGEDTVLGKVVDTYIVSPPRTLGGWKHKLLFNRDKYPRLVGIVRLDQLAPDAPMPKLSKKQREARAVHNAED